MNTNSSSGPWTYRRSFIHRSEIGASSRRRCRICTINDSKRAQVTWSLQIAQLPFCGLAWPWPSKRTRCRLRAGQDRWWHRTRWMGAFSSLDIWTTLDTVPGCSLEDMVIKRRMITPSALNPNANSGEKLKTQCIDTIETNPRTQLCAALVGTP